MKVLEGTKPQTSMVFDQYRTAVSRKESAEHDISRAKEFLRHYQKELAKAVSRKKAACRAIKNFGQPRKKCSNHRWEHMFIDGLSSNGRVCSKCGALGHVKSDLGYMTVTVALIKPSRPFHRGCKHPSPKGYNDVPRGVLCKPGFYCPDCGACWEEAPAHEVSNYDKEK